MKIQTLYAQIGTTEPSTTLYLTGLPACLHSAGFHVLPVLFLFHFKDKLLDDSKPFTLFYAFISAIGKWFLKIR